MKAGFAKIDITPELGTRKGGWLTYLPATDILDPLFAGAAVFEFQGVCAGFIQLDVVSIRWSMVAEIRRRIEAEIGIPGANIMVSATHNHASPDLHKSLLVDPRQPDDDKRYRLYPRDEKVIEFMVGKCREVFVHAWTIREEAVLGAGKGFEGQVAHNRRMVMRDGMVKTGSNFQTPDVFKKFSYSCGDFSCDALYIEGPVDPEVGVLAAKSPEGKPLGCLVNYSAHPIHHGGGHSFSAGYPGIVKRLIQERGYGTCLFLNGASGNIGVSDSKTGVFMDMEQAGRRLADVVTEVLDSLEWSQDWSLSSQARTLQLPFRRFTDEEIHGRVFGAQRFIDPKIYDVSMPHLVDRIRRRKVQPAEIQAIHIGNLSYVGVPAEYFVEYGLRLKIAAHPAKAYIVGQANGMVGYVPTREAFQRGGYETTFAPWSCLAPQAGDMILDAAIDLVCHKSACTKTTA